MSIAMLTLSDIFQQLKEAEAWIKAHYGDEAARELQNAVATVEQVLSEYRNGRVPPAVYRIGAVRDPLAIKVANRFLRRLDWELRRVSTDDAGPRWVYRGINETKKEIYFGVSKDPRTRILDYHHEGETKAIAHWNCEPNGDAITWATLSRHDDQQSASSIGHALEKIRVPGYRVIQTAGI